jgi:hypothetical protein
VLMKQESNQKGLMQNRRLYIELADQRLL